MVFYTVLQSCNKVLDYTFEWLQDYVRRTSTKGRHNSIQQLQQQKNIKVAICWTYISYSNCTFLFRDIELGFCYDYYYSSLWLCNTLVAMKLLISTFILFIYQQLTLLFVIFIFYIFFFILNCYIRPYFQRNFLFQVFLILMYWRSMMGETFALNSWDLRRSSLLLLLYHLKLFDCKRVVSWGSFFQAASSLENQSFYTNIYFIQAANISVCKNKHETHGTL